MMPDSCVDFLLGWVSGDESQMPAVAAGPSKSIEVKEIRVEACRLLGLITPKCSRFETVQEALLQVMAHCTEMITEVDVAVAALEALGSNFAASDDRPDHIAELTQAVIALLKMKASSFPDISTGEVEDRIMVAQTAALTALSKLQPPAELCDHLNSFLLKATTPADLLWEPAAAALQACRLAHPTNAKLTAAITESYAALEWVLKTKATSRTSAHLVHSSQVTFVFSRMSDCISLCCFNRSGRSGDDEPGRSGDGHVRDEVGRAGALPRRNHWDIITLN